MASNSSIDKIRVILPDASTEEDSDSEVEFVAAAAPFEAARD